jgi:molybdate-binding protein
VAGVHLVDAGGLQANIAAVRARFPHQDMAVVNLTRWRQGLVLAPGNPHGIQAVQDLVQPGLRLARRGEGAGATKLLRAQLPGPLPDGPSARGHAEVAQLVRVGAADAGVAIEAVALALGLDFLPLAEERFDLVVPTESLAHPAVARLLDALTGRAFRAEAGRMPGYDLGIIGETTPVAAA